MWTLCKISAAFVVKKSRPTHPNIFTGSSNCLPHSPRIYRRSPKTNNGFLCVRAYLWYKTKQYHENNSSYSDHSHCHCSYTSPAYRYSYPGAPGKINGLTLINNNLTQISITLNTCSVILHKAYQMKTLIQFYNYLLERAETFTRSFSNLLNW